MRFWAPTRINSNSPSSLSKMDNSHTRRLYRKWTPITLAALWKVDIDNPINSGSRSWLTDISECSLNANHFWFKKTNTPQFLRLSPLRESVQDRSTHHSSNGIFPIAIFSMTSRFCPKRSEWWIEYRDSTAASGMNFECMRFFVHYCESILGVAIFHLGVAFFGFLVGTGFLQPFATVVARAINKQLISFSEFRISIIELALSTLKWWRFPLRRHFPLTAIRNDLLGTLGTIQSVYFTFKSLCRWADSQTSGSRT